MKKNSKILIVDDQRLMRLTLTSILEVEGYQTLAVEDGYQAIEAVKKRGVKIVLLDIKMPGINGVETLKKIKKIDPNLQVIMITSYSQGELIEEAMEEGAYAYLPKPFPIEKMLEMIKNIEQKQSGKVDLMTNLTKT